MRWTRLLLFSNHFWVISVVVRIRSVDPVEFIVSFIVNVWYWVRDCAKDSSKILSLWLWCQNVFLWNETWNQSKHSVLWCSIIFYQISQPVNFVGDNFPVLMFSMINLDLIESKTIIFFCFDCVLEDGLWNFWVSAEYNTGVSARCEYWTSEGTVCSRLQKVTSGMDYCHDALSHNAIHCDNADPLCDVGKIVFCLMGVTQPSNEQHRPGIRQSGFHIGTINIKKLMSTAEFWRQPPNLTKHPFGRDKKTWFICGLKKLPPTAEKAKSIPNMKTPLDPIFLPSVPGMGGGGGLITTNQNFAFFVSSIFTSPSAWIGYC